MRDIPYGYCHCGCGGKTELCPYTARSIGWVKGEPKRYIHGHQSRKPGPKYAERDLGYITPCWLFLGHVGKKGYGSMRPHGSKTMRAAHVAFYVAAKGPVPEGKQLDHLCHSADLACSGGPCLHRRCVNPDHLAPATPKENSERGRIGKRATPAKRPKPTHCRKGHEMTPENTIVSKEGWWRCRTCDNAQQRKRYRRKKGGGGQ